MCLGGTVWLITQAVRPSSWASSPILAPDLIYHIRKQTFLLTESRKDLCKDKDDDKYNKYQRLSSFWLPTSDISENTLYHQSPEKSTKPKESKSRNTLLMLFFKAYSFFIVFFFLPKVTKSYLHHHTCNLRRKHDLRAFPMIYFKITYHCAFNF